MRFSTLNLSGMALLLLSVVAVASSAGVTNQAAPSNEWIKVVVDPYEHVDWVEFQRHKANMHTHTTESDGDMTPDQVIDEYRERGYTILAITDHNRCTYPWENWGRYPDQLGMLAIAGNELSLHHHLNSFFVPFVTSSPNVDLTLELIGSAGGLAMLNHPGRYSLTVQQYVQWYDTYDHLFGMEVINQGGRYNGDWSPVWPGNDIHLWDLVLSDLMPERPVWGVAADDMHSIGHLGRDWLTYLIPAAEATSSEGEDRPWMQDSVTSAGPDHAVVRQATQLGQYYFSSVATHPTDFRDVAQTPVINGVVVDDAAGSVTISASSGGQPLPAGDYRWISMGTQVQVGPTINFRTTPGVGSYVRAEMRGQGGTTYTNPFGIDFVGPMLAVSVSEISREVHFGQPLSADSFTVANSGPDTLSYTVASDADWLAVWPEGGESSGEAGLIDVAYDLSDLPIARHEATITLTSFEAGNSPYIIPVTVDIRTVKPDLDLDGDVDQTDFGLFQVCVGAPADSAGCEAADLNEAGSTIDDADVNVFYECLSGVGFIATPGCDQ